MTAVALTTPPHIVVFGRDKSGKPHASWFDQASAELATKAAGLMNMHAVPIENDALRELAGTLPKGRVFSSGRAFTPFIAGKLYGQLVELTRDVLGLNEGEPAARAKAEAAEPSPAPEGQQPKEAEVAPPAAPAAAAAPGAPVAVPAAIAHPAPAAAVTKAPMRPSRVEDVGIGSCVLATTGPMEGWWEAEVIGLNGNMLTLRWRDFAEPTVVRRRTDVSLLPALQG